MGKQLPYWHAVELTAGSRPVLRENEIDVLVEDDIGLYQGKAKINNRQNGRGYLTSQRIIYIDNIDPKKYSLSIELDDIKNIDYSSRFLKSSPKIIIFFKKFKNSNNNSNKFIKKDINWICPICSFPNLVKEDLNYNNYEVLPICETCGVKSSKEVIEETIKSFKNHTTNNQLIETRPNQVACNVCTFLNHPSLRNCEICGSSLPDNENNLEILNKQEIFDDRIKIEIESNDDLTIDNSYIKISFHGNNKGDKIFFNKLNEVIENFNWESVLKTGNVNKSVILKNDEIIINDKTKDKKLSFGIHSITQINETINEKNEQIINSSLDNLDELLNKADEISQLINSFKPLKQDQNNQINFKEEINNNLIINLNLNDSKSLYIQEISRKISEFLINGSILKEQGGMITLLDLYALFNRGRIGENLISPKDLYESCLEFENLKLPLILKKINSILVISSIEENLDKIIFDIKNFILNNGEIDISNYKYSTVLKISEFFNWNLNITEEFLKIGLELGYFVIDKQIFGKHYYLNLFNDNKELDYNKVIKEKKLIEDVVVTV